MASQISTNASFTYNGVNLSPFVTAVSFSYEAEEQDETAMGDTTRKAKGGLKVWSFDVTFKQDYAAGAVDATLWSQVGGVNPVTYKADAAATSATNPQYSGSALLVSYVPNPGNSVGELATATARFVSAGTLSRATA